MKARVILILISVVLLGSDSVVAMPADATTAGPPEWLCILSQSAATTPPGSSPASQIGNDVQLCGGCSHYVCANSQIGSPCRTFQMLNDGICIPNGYNICQADGRENCSCVENIN